MVQTNDSSSAAPTGAIDGEHTVCSSGALLRAMHSCNEALVCFPWAVQLETSFTNKETPGRDFSGDDHGANDSSSPEIVFSKLREGLGFCLHCLLYFECATTLASRWK